MAIKTVIAVFAITVCIAAGCKTAGPTTAASQIPEVVVAEVTQRDVPIYAVSIGTTEGFVNAEILPKISGYLLKQDYKDGSHVNKGQLLFEIDDRPYRAALDQALGTLAQQEAELKKNQQDLDRYTPLYRQSVVSKQTFDHVKQAFLASQAQTKAARAAVEAARLNLDWTRVYSPIDGVAGIAKAQVGNLVSNTTLLTTVSQLNPIKVSFPISEQEYLHFAERINARENEKPKDSGVPFELILGNGSVYGYPGRFYAADRQINVQTGTIQIQAVFPNPEDILRPGMYAKIRARTGVRHDAMLAPQSAVFEIQGQYEVAVVGPDNRVAIRTVKPGQKVDGLWLIDEGLKPGERVVTEGVQKVKDGMRVTPITAHRPSPSTNRAHTGRGPSAGAPSVGRK